MQHSRFSKLALFLACLPLCASTFPVTVVGTTNTQATLTWSHAGDCTLEVSESNTYSPVVNDVNATLFTNANSTTRAEALNSGSTHIFVVGKRTTDLALNTSYYSRGLQNTTTHYFRITCGADTGTGTFVTKNIPYAMTWADNLQTDTSNPGNFIVPTFVNDRSLSYIDPRTGAFIKPLTQPNDITVSPNTPFGSSSGFQEWCSSILSTNGFYHCIIPNDYAPYLYGINPTDGSARFLGTLYYFGQSIGLNSGVQGCYNGSNAMWDDADPNVIYCGGVATNQDTVAVKLTYTGNDVPVTSGQVGGLPPPASMSLSVLTPPPNTLTALLNTFSAGSVGYNCGMESYQANQFAITCRRGQQDSYAWIGSYDLGNKSPSNGHVVALISMWSQPTSRWCTEHTYEYMGNTVILSHGTQSPKGGGTGLGPYLSQFAADVPGASPGDHTNITVTSTYSFGTPPAGYATGEPVSPELDHFLMTAQVGDMFFTVTGEFMQISAKADSQHWTVLRGVGSSVGFPTTPHSTGQNLQAWCNANTIDPSTLPYMWWNAEASPTASANYGANFGGHPATRGNHRLDGGWTFRNGDITDSSTWGIYNFTGTILPSPTFAGAMMPADGNYFEKHPSIPDSAPAWFLDVAPYIGGNLAQVQDDSSTVNITGDLWRYIYNGLDADGLSRKQAATFAVTGNGSGTDARALVDVSGPGCVLDGTSAHAYQYAVPNANNECFSGSVKGNIYFNIPAAVFPVGSRYCKGADQGAVFSICIGDVPTIGFALQHDKLAADSTGASLRALSKVFAVPHYSTTGNAKVLADGSWGIFWNTLANGYGMFLVKVPPIPTSDGVDRTTFIRAPLSLTAPMGLGVSTVKVSFWYGEEGGTSSSPYCTSRREGCIAVSSTVTDSNPFSYATTDSYSPLACSISCTITLPVLPMHTAYFKVSYLNGGGMEVATDSGIASESAVVSLGSITPASGGGMVVTGHTVMSGSVKR